MARGERATADNFWKRVSILGEEDCWEFTGYRDSRGYGSLGFPSLTGKVGLPIRAHQAAYALATTGRMPPRGTVVHHLCGNPPCCNPKHLVAMSSKDHTTMHQRFRSATHYQDQSAERLKEILIELENERIRLETRIDLVKSELERKQRSRAGLPLPRARC
jgi:hypothetical protein